MEDHCSQFVKRAETIIDTNALEKLSNIETSNSYNSLMRRGPNPLLHLYERFGCNYETCDKRTVVQFQRKNCAMNVEHIISEEDKEIDSDTETAVPDLIRIDGSPVGSEETSAGGC